MGSMMFAPAAPLKASRDVALLVCELDEEGPIGISGSALPFDSSDASLSSAHSAEPASWFLLADLPMLWQNNAWEYRPSWCPEPSSNPWLACPSGYGAAPLPVTGPGPGADTTVGMAPVQTGSMREGSGRSIVVGTMRCSLLENRSDFCFRPEEPLVTG